MADNLPVYEMRIEASTESDLQVTAIALVDSPAIEKNWLAFNADRDRMTFAQVDEEQQIIVGPAMIPDMLIYRNDPKLGEYNVYFAKTTVQSIAEKFYKKCFQGNANLMHDPAQTVEGVNYFMSFIRDSKKGLIGLEGDYPEGTWFVGAKVENAAVWADIKAGKIKGFSVEGLFEYNLAQEAPTEAEAALEKIKVILNGIKF